MKALSPTLCAFGLVLTLFVAPGTVHAQPRDYPQITFGTWEINLGKVQVGQSSQFQFDFEITDKAPLLITHVRSTNATQHISTLDRFVGPVAWGSIAGVVQARDHGFAHETFAVYSNTSYKERYVRGMWHGE